MTELRVDDLKVGKFVDICVDRGVGESVWVSVVVDEKTDDSVSFVKRHAGRNFMLKCKCELGLIKTEADDLLIKVKETDIGRSLQGVQIEED